MLLSELLDIIEHILPADSAMDGDKIGLQVQGGIDEINKVLVTLEITDSVIEEAVKLNCNCIITFHPLIYSSLKSIINNDRVGNLCHKIIQNSIAVISVHTTFDTFSEGTSRVIAENLDLEVIDFLLPDKKYENKGMGVVAKPKTETSISKLLEDVSNLCKSPLRYSKTTDIDNIKKVAIVGGSGTSFLSNVLKSGAEAFITADITYHRFHEVYNQLLLIDPGHYEMEQFVPQALHKLLNSSLKDNVEIRISKIHTNPVSYYPNPDEYMKLQKEYLLKID